MKRKSFLVVLLIISLLLVACSGKLTADNIDDLTDEELKEALEEMSDKDIGKLVENLEEDGNMDAMLRIAFAMLGDMMQ